MQAVCAKILAVDRAPLPTINFNRWLWLTSYIVNLYLHYGSIFKNNQCSLTYFIVLLFSFIKWFLKKMYIWYFTFLYSISEHVYVTRLDPVSTPTSTWLCLSWALVKVRKTIIFWSHGYGHNVIVLPADDGTKMSVDVSAFLRTFLQFSLCWRCVSAKV